jgi:AcrR family transcriptional regulator
MPRDGEKVRRRLQQAALDLYQERGYHVTTAAEIAAKAGVTERTFFRHFSDKRDVLFGGDTVLSDALTSAIRGASAEFGPWETLFRAFRSAEYLFIENRSFAEPRQRLIESTPALQERALDKTRLLIAALVSALRERGVPEHVAMLVAQLGMAALSHAVRRWFIDDSSDLDDHVVQTFQEIRELTNSAQSI